MSDSSNSSSKAQPVQGYPLVTLFFLVAVIAVLVSLLSPVAQAVRRNEVAGGQLVEAGLGGLAVTLVLSTVVGLFHHRQPRGFFIGLLVGVLTGPMIGILTLAPISAGSQLLLTTFGGGVLLVLLGFVLRFNLRDKVPAEITDD